MRRTLSILVLIPLGAAAFWSARLAYSESLDVDGAAALIPNNSSYLAQAALAVELDGRDPSPLLEQILRINPTSSQARVRLGLAAEQRGDIAQAEKWLLEAFSVDRQYETRWSLANFYFRQERWPDFWKWMRSALEMSYGDRTAAFDLCWRASEDPSQILRVIPDSARDAYLIYLVDRRRVDAISSAAAGVRDANLLLAATDILIEAKRFGESVELWKRSGHTQPQGINDPRFQLASSGRGFDWRFAQTDGVTHQQLENGRGHRIRLSGRQPEATVLLSQYVSGLHPGQRYRIGLQLDGDAEGFQWRVAGQPIVTDFTAAAEVVLAELWYVRPQGAVRAEGVFDLREVTLSALH